MDITLHFKAIKSTNSIDRERDRKAPGTVIEIYNPALISTLVGNQWELNEPINLAGSLRFLTLRNFPDKPIQKIKNRFLEVAHLGDDIDPAQIIRHRSWLISFTGMIAARNQLIAAGEITLNWPNVKNTIVRRVDITQIENPDSDTEGRAIVEGDFD